MPVEGLAGRGRLAAHSTQAENAVEERHQRRERKPAAPRSPSKRTPSASSSASRRPAATATSPARRNPKRGRHARTRRAATRGPSAQRSAARWESARARYSPRPAPTSRAKARGCSTRLERLGGGGQPERLELHGLARARSRRAGRSLRVFADQHEPVSLPVAADVGYETVEPYPLTGSGWPGQTQKQSGQLTSSTPHSGPRAACPSGFASRRRVPDVGVACALIGQLVDAEHLGLSAPPTALSRLVRDWIVGALPRRAARTRGSCADRSGSPRPPGSAGYPSSPRRLTLAGRPGGRQAPRPDPLTLTLSREGRGDSR